MFGKKKDETKSWESDDEEIEGETGVSFSIQKRTISNSILVQCFDVHDHCPLVFVIGYFLFEAGHLIAPND